MKELEYPFDASELIRRKKSLRRQLLADQTPRVAKKIAVLGGSTTSDIVKMLELFLLNYGIAPTFYESEYAQYFQDAMFPSQELLDFQPDLVFIHTTNRNVTNYPVVTDTPQQIEDKLHAELEKVQRRLEQHHGEIPLPHYSEQL